MDMTGSSVVESLRDAAMARAAILGLPTTAAEDWRYVNVRPLQTTPEDLDAHPLRIDTDTSVLNGAFVVSGPFSALSDEQARFDGERLAQEQEAPACWSWTGERRYLRIDGQRSLNLVHQATSGITGWRLLLDLAPGADVHLVLTHLIWGNARASVGLVVKLGQSARLRVSEVMLQTCQLFVQVDASVGRDATITWTSASRGGDLLRWRGVIDLVATGAHADIAAVDQVTGHDQAHRHLRVRHRVGPTTSTQLFKTVLNDHAIASFDGLVDVAKGADGANAAQLSRTLLLSPTARGDTRPQLDIHADEVKAGHGATIGQLDTDELLYLRMRGLAPEQARSLLIDGFVREVTARLPETMRP